jgi:hypothetical protein
VFFSRPTKTAAYCSFFASDASALVRFMDDQIRELRKTLFECSATSKAFKVRPTNNSSGILYWDEIEEKVEKNLDQLSRIQEIESKQCEFSQHKASLEYDFNMMCFDAIIKNSDTSPGSMNRKALDLFRKGQKVLCDQKWDKDLICLKCKLHKEEQLYSCDFCYRSYHNECGQLSAQSISHPMRYTDTRKCDSCWFCSDDCAGKFKHIMKRVKVNLRPQDKPSFVLISARTLSDRHEAYRIVLAASRSRLLYAGIVLERVNMSSEQRQALDKEKAKIVNSSVQGRNAVLVLWVKADFNLRPADTDLLTKSKWAVCTDYEEIVHSYDQALAMAHARATSGELRQDLVDEFEEYFNGAHYLQDYFLRAEDNDDGDEIDNSNGSKDVPESTSGAETRPGGRTRSRSSTPPFSAASAAAAEDGNMSERNRSRSITPSRSTAQPRPGRSRRGSGRNDSDTEQVPSSSGGGRHPAYDSERCVSEDETFQHQRKRRRETSVHGTACDVLGLGGCSDSKGAQSAGHCDPAIIGSALEAGACSSVGLVYNAKMELHRADKYHHERPERIQYILAELAVRTRPAPKLAYA